MSNNYTQTSFMVRLPAEALAYLGEQLAAREQDEFPIACEQELDADGLWLYGVESFDIEAVADLIHATLDKFGLQDVVWFEWADTCSKPRLGEFSGGGVRITKDGAEWFTPYAMMRAKHPGEG